LKFDKVTENLTVGTFLRHNVDCEQKENIFLFMKLKCQSLPFGVT